MQLTNLGIRNRWSLPVIASAYTDSNEYGVVDQHNHIVIGISSRLSKEDAEYLASVINTCADLEQRAEHERNNADNLREEVADLERQLAMKNWPTKYDELMCDPVFRAAYAKEWAITDGDNLRMQLNDNPPQPIEAGWSWECNECGANEHASSASEDDISKERYSCGNYGSTKFHRVASL